MNKKILIKHILENAEKINQKNNLINETFKNRDADRQTWEKACDDFHATYDQLAFPGGLENANNLLKKQDPAIIETAIIYLEADPYFHRSGYIKQTLIRLLKKADLSQEQIKQLHAILLAAIKHDGRREYIEYCRLAKKINTPEFEQKIQDIITTVKDAKVIDRAKKMLATMKG